MGSGETTDGQRAAVSLSAAADGDWVRLSAAAAFLGVSPITVRRWADAGRLECTRTPGGQRRFRRSDLERLLAGDGDGGSRGVAAAHVAPPSASRHPRTLAEERPMFASLREASHAIAASVTLDDVLATVARQAGLALHTQDCVIFAYDHLDDTLTARAIYEAVATDYTSELTEPFPVEDYGGGREILTRTSVLIERISDPGLDPRSRASMEEYGEKVCLTVPLRFADEALGFLVLTEVAEEREFSEAEVELAAALGEQAAVALHNAVTLDRREHQTKRLAALLGASRAATSSLIPEEVLDAVAHTTAEALKISDCIIISYEPAGDRLVVRAVYQVEPKGDVILGESLPLSDYPMGREILEGGAVVEERISDPRLDPRSRASMEEYGEQTCLTVPLRYGDEPVGLLVITENEFERRFSMDELELAAGLGEQAAAAIHNAELYRARGLEAARLASLLDASRAASTFASLPEALGVVARHAAEGLGGDRCLIFEHDTEAEVIIPQALYEVAPGGWDAMGRSISLDDHALEREILTAGVPVFESISDPDLDEISRGVLERWEATTCLSVPLRFGDESVGLLEVYSGKDASAFTDDELSLTVALGEQAAVAIHNSQLIGRLEDQNRRLSALLQVSASASSLVFDDVLHSVVDQALTLFDVRSCVIWEFMPELDALSERCSVDLDDPSYVATREVWPLAEHESERRTLQGHVPVIETVSDPDLDPVVHESMAGWGEQTCLTVPLWAGSEPLGMLVMIETRFERTFTASELELAQAIGEQAALVIHNAKLFGQTERRGEELAERNRHLMSLLDVSRALTSTVQIDDVLEIVARAGGQALSCAECLIYEYDEENDAIIARSFYSRGPSDYVDHLGTSFALSDYPPDRLILASSEIVIETISDPQLPPQTRASMDRYGEKTCLNVPLRFGDAPLGIMALIEVDEERTFSQSELELAHGLGEQASAAIHNARLFAALGLRTRETGLLNEIARKATASLNVVEVARATVEEIRRLMHFERAGLVIADESGCFHAVFSTDERTALFDGATLADFEDETVQRLARGEVEVVNADDGDSVAVVGLVRDAELTGLLALGSGAETSFSRADRRFLEELGAHLSLAVNNAGLFENVKLMHLGNLRALSSALNAKDYYTLGHTARVAAYAVLLARQLGWKPELIDQVEEIAYLHDIGKIAVSDRSLLKPGPLSEEEWALMREHPVISADIIAPLLGEHLVAGVRHHHEYYDGSGYPDGLSGEGISPIARLLCVVDSYDAMSSLRLYRQALTYRQCLTELEQGKGSQFDPAMVDAFVAVLEYLKEIKGRALVAAWEAAVEIEGALHGSLIDPAERSEAAYDAVHTVLEQTRARDESLVSMATEVRIDEHRSMIVVTSGDDPERVQRRGEVLLADQEQMEAYSGRPMDTNVLFVDDQGAWVCGLAPILADNGEIVGLVRAEVPATDISGPLGGPSSVRQTFAGLAHDAASRLMRVEIDSMIDGLSGLYNHRYLHERLSEEVSRALGNGSELTVLFCDVDGFKKVNDLHGHRTGDEVLRRMAQLIGKTIRRIDLAARYGGDEFAVVLIESNADQAYEIAERIRRSIADARLVPGDDSPTVSIGLATLPGDASTKTEILDKADWAMYLAKRRGRNRCVRFGDA